MKTNPLGSVKVSTLKLYINCVLLLLLKQNSDLPIFLGLAIHIFVHRRWQQAVLLCIFLVCNSFIYCHVFIFLARVVILLLPGNCLTLVPWWCFSLQCGCLVWETECNCLCIRDLCADSQVISFTFLSNLFCPLMSSAHNFIL
jgi:hypothetical protein